MNIIVMEKQARSFYESFLNEKKIWIKIDAVLTSLTKNQIWAVFCGGILLPQKDSQKPHKILCYLHNYYNNNLCFQLTLV